MELSPHRVLVIDDVVDNVGVLFEFLQAAGFRVLVSESARHAIDQLPRMAPDIILLDVMMPEMDGLEACRRIKSLPEFADVPILFMTALSDPVDKVRGLQAGAADYITKPLFPEEVLARINVHLELRERNRQLAEQNERLDAAIQQQIAAERALSHSLDRAVLVADGSGNLAFIANAAVKLLRRYFPDFDGTKFPRQLAQWLAAGGSPSLTATQDGRRLELTCSPAPAGNSHRLVYLDEKAPPATPEMLLGLGLTPREAEVLFWIAQGKTSPEIAIIVGNAAGTVKKQVASITAKLGVETRLAAALKAMEILGLAT